MKRLCCFLLTLIIVVSFAATPHHAARAQGGNQALCNGLSEADCQTLTDAQNAMKDVHLFTVPNWSVNLNMNADGEQTTLSGSGAITIVPPQALIAFLSDLGANPVATPEALSTLLDQLDSQTVQQWLSELAADLVLNNLTYSGSGDSGSFSGEAIVKDGSFYVQVPSPTGAVTWFGGPMDITAADWADFDTQLQDLRDSLNSADFQALWDNQAQMSGVNAQPMADLANRYVTTTREADATLQDQSMAVFTTTFDLVGFLSDPELGTQIADMMNNPAMAQMNEGQSIEVTPAQMQLLLQAIKMMVTNSKMSLTLWIGADDGYIHQVSASLALTADPSVLTGEDTGTFDLSFDGSVEMNNFNDVSADSVVAPDSYLPLDASNDYSIGMPDMIAAQLEPGQTFSGTLSDDESKDIYGVMLDAGKTVEIDVEPSDVASVQVIGPDGFESEWQSSDEIPFTFTAEQSGQHLIILHNMWGGDYTITIRPQ